MSLSGSGVPASHAIATPGGDADDQQRRQPHRAAPQEIAEIDAVVADKLGEQIAGQGHEQRDAGVALVEQRKGKHGI